MIKTKKKSSKLNLRGQTVKALSGIEMSGIRGGGVDLQWTGTHQHCCNDPD
jgi:hypothetical protein